MTKTHFKVTLDVYAVVDDGVNSAELLGECGFIVDPERDETGEEMEVQDITVEDVEVTDSR